MAVEINPVAWYYDHGDGVRTGDYVESTDDGIDEREGMAPLYAQSTIDALLAEVAHWKRQIDVLKEVAGGSLRVGQGLIGEYQARAERAEAEAAALKGGLTKLLARWHEMAATHGVRQFTGNDHALFANELAATMQRAAMQEGAK